MGVAVAEAMGEAVGEAMGEAAWARAAAVEPPWFTAEMATAMIADNARISQRKTNRLSIGKSILLLPYLRSSMPLAEWNVNGAH